MQSERVIQGKMIEGRLPVVLSVVLDVVETEQAVGVVVDFGAGRVGVEPEIGTVGGLVAVAVAIELESPLAVPMEIIHCEIVVALTVEAASAPLVAVLVSMPAEKYRRTDRTQCP